KNGEYTLKASGKTCVSCHTKDHDKMLNDWVKEISKEVKDARELETEAKKTLAKFKGKLPKEKLNEARKMLREGRYNLRIVEYGNGVHNKKYSMMLLDAAMNNFEDLMDELEEGN
ncbi:MAG: ammonia-forming cytochrome c nitrite reductase subunit c552, partial [Planctomycetota bacterium]